MELLKALIQILLLLATAPALETLNAWLHSSPRTISPPANSTFHSATSYTVAPPLSYSYGDSYTAGTTPSPFLFAHAAAPRRCDILHGSCEVFVTEMPAVGPTPYGPVYDFSTVFVWFLVVAGLCALGSTLAALKQRCESLEQKNDMLAAESIAVAVRNTELLAIIKRQDQRQARQEQLYEHSVQHIVELEQTVSQAHAAQAVAISERDATCARVGELEKQEARHLEEAASEVRRLEQQSREQCGKIAAQQTETAGLKADLTTETAKSAAASAEVQSAKMARLALEQRLGASERACEDKEVLCSDFFDNAIGLRAEIERLKALHKGGQVEQRSSVGDAEIPDVYEWSRRSLMDYSSSWKGTSSDREITAEASNEDSDSVGSSVEVVIATHRDPSPAHEDAEVSIATHRDPSPTRENTEVSIATQRDPSPPTTEQQQMRTVPQLDSLPRYPTTSTLSASVASFMPSGSSNPFSTSTTSSSGPQASPAQGTSAKKTRRTQRGGRNHRRRKDAAAASADEQDEVADGNGDGDDAPGPISSTPSGTQTSTSTSNNNAQAPRLPGLLFWNPNGLMASRHAH
ncbi:hypothetical protein LTR87_011253 [Friedmanniomyces endolithicus]|nr:hypothetical protein LTR87_011253 [Friedmanniomyces endolithicus]